MNQKVIAIVGPTGSHKSHIAIDLIKKMTQPAELISVDAFQVYKALNVGVNKPDVSMLNEVKHHFVSCLELNDEWNINVFQKQAKALIDHLFNQNILPVLCGGSHLYVDALIRNFNLNKAQKRFINLDGKLSSEQLYDHLMQLDYDEAIKIGKNNPRRLARAIEICLQTGKKKSELDQDVKHAYETLHIVCYRKNRAELYEKLDVRTTKMFANGWVDEIKGLMEQYPNFLSLQAAKAIGYYYLGQQLTRHDAFDLEYLKKIIRNLAKRQLTWCKSRYKNNAIWFDYTKDSFDQLLDDVITFLNN